jgi:hypothetical protein
VSGPTSIQVLLDAWQSGLTHDEHLALGALHMAVAEAIRRAQKVPSTIDRRCMALVVTKLEEAEHWALQARRVAIDRDHIPGQSDR